MLGLGILYFRLPASAPWHVSQVKSANVLPSKFWKIGFIFGITAVFMYSRRWTYFMSFQATSGGPTTFVLARPAAVGNKVRDRTISDESEATVKRIEGCSHRRCEGSRHFAHPDCSPPPRPRRR